MSIVLHLEESITAVSETLQTYLPDVITEINEMTTGKDLAAIMAWDEGYDDILGRRGYPLCTVAGGEPSYEPSGQRALDSEQTVVVWLAFYIAGDPGFLHKALLRYTEAIRYVIQNNHTLGGKVVDAVPDNVEWYSGAAGNKTFGAVEFSISIENEVRGG